MPKAKFLRYAGRYIRRPPIRLNHILKITDREVRFWAKDTRAKRMVELLCRSGMMTLRHLLQPFLLEPLPVTLAGNLATYNLKPVASARSRNDTCDICRANPQQGFGDCGEPIGLSAEVAAALKWEED